MYFGVGDTRMIINDRVDVCVPHERLMPSVTRFPRGSCPVLVPLGSSHEPPTATVRYIAEFLHINMDERTGMVVFVTPRRFPGPTVDVRESVQSFAYENSVHGRCRQTGEPADLDRP